jgi:hypothetical protein
MAVFFVVFFIFSNFFLRSLSSFFGSGFFGFSDFFVSFVGFFAWGLVSFVSFGFLSLLSMLSDSFSSMVYDLVRVIFALLPQSFTRYPESQPDRTASDVCCGGALNSNPDATWLNRQTQTKLAMLTSVILNYSESRATALSKAMILATTGTHAF